MTIMSAKRKVVIENEDSNDDVSIKSANSNEDESGHKSDDADGENSDEDNTEELNDNADSLANAGWADSIAKILKTNKPKGKKTLVLSRAKKLSDVKKNKPQPAGFQVATAEGDVKEEFTEVKQEENESVEPPRKKKKELPTFRLKPNILQKDRERLLAKIATKGVVQLFNAVKMQQKDIKEKLNEAGPLEIRKEKVLKNIDKRAFLDVLMGDKAKSENIDKVISSQTNSEESKDKTTWSVLRDDFMMGAKLKDWDKELEENESEQEQIVESD